MPRACLVITSIGGADGILADLAAASLKRDVDLIVIGDRGSPPGFELEGCDFYSLERQRGLDLALARICPEQSYARKNLGYLLAMQRGAQVIVETDDDTVPYDAFWDPPERSRVARTVSGAGWVNVYRYFSTLPVWPRGFPLDEVRQPAAPLDPSPPREVESPIQQSLVDRNPDVDAVYRLLFDLPFSFSDGPSIALPPGAWCPFNSQNTTWWAEAFPLLYLPATCSFRMTDIWRSFVAQRLAWVNGWRVLFHAPTVGQERNMHDLMRDFRHEVPGYLENKTIRNLLDRLALRPGPEQIAPNLRTAYGALVDGGLLDPSELDLLDAWLADLATIAHRRGRAPATSVPGA